MPSIIETTVYYFDELPDAGKEKARAWYCEGGLDYDWFDFVYEDFERVCDILGIRLDTVPVRIFGGGTRHKPCIWFSGFWSQGDGACFEGDYSYAKGASAAIRRYAPKDFELRRIADGLGAIQRRNFYQLGARITHRGRYHHEYSMAIAVERDSPGVQDRTDDADEDVREALRDVARWLYRRLEDEYEHLTSDEAVDESIRLNEYSFTEDGVRFG
jgi:hypothetical protein